MFALIFVDVVEKRARIKKKEKVRELKTTTSNDNIAGNVSF